MKNKLSIFILLVFISGASTSMLKAQNSFDYEPSEKHPYGLPNPEMPKAFLDYAPLVGECACKSLVRIDQNTWGDTVVMTWRFKYIMNGRAVQDETLKADGSHSGSIRQFVSDSARCYVHYYSSAKPSSALGTWEGNVNDEGDMVLYKDQPAPNGAEGYYKIMFTEISDRGFNWLGQWVSKDESIAYPLWKIFCKKRKG